MTNVIVLIGAGCATGVTTVLFGFGGGFITVPAVFAAVQTTAGSDAMHTAVATSTAIMVVNASLATLASARQRRLDGRYLWPITAFISIGAGLGAVAANWASETVLHVSFIVYIGATIVDSVFRRGFVDNSAGPTEARPLSTMTSTAGGVVIGAIASFLGIGGSVITVPLLRRRGVAMAAATALANPLSVPVAIAGTVVYACATPAGPHPHQLGYTLCPIGVLGYPEPVSGLVRAVRQQRRMTLDELASSTGLTKSYLSKVEREHSVPSISAALKISRALDVDVAQLFSDDPEAGTLAVDRSADRGGSGRNHAIGASMLGKAMSPFIVRPGRQFVSHAHSTHPGQEFVFVHSGAVELNHNGRIITLETGDAAYFDATVSHKLRQIGTQTAEVLVVAHDAPR